MSEGKSVDNKTMIKVMAAAIIGHVFWGFSFMASRIALDATNMFVMLSHRFIVAWFVMSLLILFGVMKIDWKGKNILPLIVMAIAEPVVYFIGEPYGILHTTTIFSGVMIAMIPLASVLAAAIVLKEMPTGKQVLFGVISVLGVIGIGLMSKNAGALELKGVLALVISVLSAVVYVLLSRKNSAKFSAFERTYMMMCMGAFAFTIMALVSCGGNISVYLEPVADKSYLMAILFLSLFCSIGSYFMASYTIEYLTVAKQTVFANLTTAVSVFAGAILLHEPFSALGILFCIMIVVGIYGVQIEGKE